MSEGITHREILDRQEAQHGFGHLAKKKKEIAERMHKGESPRSREIRENNARYAMQGNAMKAKARHERRHEGKKGTSLKERQAWMENLGNN